MDREPANGPDDDALLKRFLAGDHSAFGTLVSRHQDRVYSVAYRMLGNEHDALDATQEAFVNAYRRSHSFQGTSTFGTWMYRVAMNTCLDLIRARRRRPVATDQVPEQPGRDESDDVVTRLDLAAALARLPDDFREPVLLHDVLGVPYEEIAVLCDTNAGTIKSRISRGRRRLAALMEQPAGRQTSKDRT